VCVGALWPMTSDGSRSGRLQHGPDAEMLMDPAKTMTWTNGKMLRSAGLILEDWQGEQWNWRRHTGLVCL